MSFRLQVMGGRVSAAPDCPAGWRVSVDNDPSWRATVAAKAIVGAAAVSPDVMAAMIRFAPAPPEVSADLGVSRMTVSAEVTVMQKGGLQTMTLRNMILAR